MRYRLLAGTAVALALAAGAGVPRLAAQDAVVTEEAAAEAAVSDDLLGEDELDELVAPVALYPDSLLTQVLVASTYPIDIVKADRFIAANADLPDKERSTAAEAEDWDPSVQVLAGGFPTVVQKMATELDWTQELGDAMLAQSDDVLDSIQRQRARAVAVGNLTSNDAQVVEETDDNISIAPAEPEVVYVPEYDAATAYTTPYAAPPVVATADTGYSTSSLITTGAIAFGSALLIDEIFDDDDDDWDDYWRHDYDHIDWDDGDIRPRPDVDINGDVNIDRSRDRNRVNVDRDRTDIDHKRIGDGSGNRETWKPSEQKRADARDRVADRERAKGREGAANRPNAGGAAANRPNAGGGRNPSAGDVSNKLAARDGTRQPSRTPGAAAGDRKAPPKAATMDTPFSPKKADAKKTKAAAARGDHSVNKAHARPQAKSPSKAVSRPKAAKSPAKKASPKSSAFKKSSSGNRTKAASSRGHKSGGGGRGGGGRGGGGGGKRR